MIFSVVLVNMAIVLLVSFSPSVGIDCDARVTSGTDPGTNIDISATCFANGIVEFEWRPVRESSVLETLQIDYTCTYNDGNTTTAGAALTNGIASLASSSILNLSPFNWNRDSSCLFHGCYVYNRASAGYPTLAIPTATCTIPLPLTSSSILIHPTSTISTATTTLVHPTSTVSTVTTTIEATSIGHRDMSSNHTQAMSSHLGSTGAVTMVTEGNGHEDAPTLTLIVAPLVAGLGIVCLVIISVLVLILWKINSDKFKRPKFMKSIDLWTMSHSIEEPPDIYLFAMSSSFPDRVDEVSLHDKLENHSLKKTYQSADDDYVPDHLSDSEPEQPLEDQLPAAGEDTLQSNDNISMATEEMIDDDTQPCGTPEEELVTTNRGILTSTSDTIPEPTGATGYIHYSTRASDKQQGDMDSELDLHIEEGDTSIDSNEPVAEPEPPLVSTVAVRTSTCVRSSSPVAVHQPSHLDIELPDMFSQPPIDQYPLSPTHSESSYVTFSR